MGRFVDMEGDGDAVLVRDFSRALSRPSMFVRQMLVLKNMV